MSEWIKSSWSGSDGCLEVAFDPDGTVRVRDSKHPGNLLRFTRTEWDEFVEGVRTGEFDAG